MDDTELYLKNVGVKRWTTKAFDRTEWTYVIRGAKAKFKGL